MKVFGITVSAIALVIGLWTWTSYNGLVNLDEQVQVSYSQLQNVLQRQAELIPNFAETVKGYAKHEHDTFTDIATARSKAGGVVNVDASKIANDPEAQKRFADASQSMASALTRLLSVSEKYPELKADKGFKDMRRQLEGSINRVTVERRNNLVAVQSFNKAVRRFPAIMIASSLGFEKKPYFEAAPDAQHQPKVTF